MRFPIPMPLRMLGRAALIAGLVSSPAAAQSTATAPAASAPPEISQPRLKGPFVADGAPGSFQHEFARRLYHASLPEAREFAASSIAAEGQVARFAHGVTLFVGALEGLSADLVRYGLLNPAGLEIPFLRLPVPPNTTPQPLDYQKFRTTLQRFVDGLTAARAALEGVDDPEIRLPLRVTMIRIDANGDGRYDAHEQIAPFFSVVARGSRAGSGVWAQMEKDTEGFMAGLADGNGGALSELRRSHPVYAFDGADAVWLQGYSHLLSAMAELLLAHDWEASFNQSFHVFFPNAGLPYAVLIERTSRKNGQMIPTADLALGFDLASFAVHSPWVPTEPERLSAVRLHLKGMIETSRKSWAMIHAETDNLTVAEGAEPMPEWIPAPAQAQARNQRVSADTVAGWLAFLDTFEGMLDGRLLIPHWRFDQGMNLRRLFEEPRPLSPILLAQGADALPYLEDGPLADSAHMEHFMNLLGGDFFTYFLWFN